jgi:zinc protease
MQREELTPMPSYLRLRPALIGALAALAFAALACRSTSPVPVPDAPPSARETPPAAPAGVDAAPAVAPRPWEHETSDVPVDPRIRFGALPNGLRFAWARNPEPQERCYVRLHVDVGPRRRG